VQRDRFVSLRLSLGKIFLAAAGLLGGLSIGREGPSVQVAAGVMEHARRWLRAGSAINVHGLLVAGGAAGIAATFNTPLAGVVFAIEELSQKLEQRNSGLILAAIVLSGLVAVSAFGNLTYFGVIKVPRLGLDLLLPGLLVVLCSGLLGGLFARLLVASLAGMPDRASRFREHHPVGFAAACGLAVAIIGWASSGATYGSGYAQTRHMLEGDPNVPSLFVLLKFVATWLSTWSGVPGGIFAPSLSIGAGIGLDVASLTNPALAAPLIAMGMAAFLAAVTQSPLTAFIIVMEMVDGHAMVLTLMTSAMLASLVARTLSRPLYTRLAEMQLKRLDPVEGNPDHDAVEPHAHSAPAPTHEETAPAPWPAPGNDVFPPPHEDTPAARDTGADAQTASLTMPHPRDPQP
jgi:H+/Cl- antiporter ClcA